MNSDSPGEVVTSHGSSRIAFAPGWFVAAADNWLNASFRRPENRVLEPAELREQVADRARRTAALYSEP